jgi:hypothetical protein
MSLEDKCLIPTDFIPLVGIVFYASRTKDNQNETKKQKTYSKVSSIIINLYHTGILGTIGYMAYQYLTK